MGYVKLKPIPIRLLIIRWTLLLMVIIWMGMCADKYVTGGIRIIDNKIYFY